MSDFISTASVKKLDFLDAQKAEEVMEIPQFRLSGKRASMLVERKDSFVKVRSKYKYHHRIVGFETVDKASKEP